jgi:uncharacterized protein
LLDPVQGGGFHDYLMLIPSAACPAECAYCFGPHVDEAMMSRETLEAVVAWQRTLRGGSYGCGAAEPADSEESVLNVAFHGGEPLVPGIAFYRMALPLLREGLAPRRVRFSIQSNLWLLTDELAGLLCEYGVRVGTSLDGPEAINDAQRGRGYFSRTMAGIERARAHGLRVGVICTLTAQSAPHAGEIFDFFLEAGLDFSIHAALPSLRHPEVDYWQVTPEAHGELLVTLLDRYIEESAQIRIGTLDSMVQSVSAGRGGICTFTDCLGGYLAVGPDGAIYPCQRFVGMEEYRLGEVKALPGMAELRASPVWRQFQARQQAVENECADCAYLAFCRGGCPYNAAVYGHLEKRDPHCTAYRRLFAHITERALAEVFAPDNIDAIVCGSDKEYGLLRRGRLLSLMREGRHPSDAGACAVAQGARRG